ncbi:MAG: hypothetical protein ACT4QD_19215, partial [Acidobacteriota bacterium]
MLSTLLPRPWFVLLIGMLLLPAGLAEAQVTHGDGEGTGGSLERLVRTSHDGPTPILDAGRRAVTGQIPTGSLRASNKQTRLVRGLTLISGGVAAMVLGSKGCDGFGKDACLGLSFGLGAGAIVFGIVDVVKSRPDTRSPVRFPNGAGPSDFFPGDTAPRPDAP